MSGSVLGSASDARNGAVSRSYQGGGGVEESGEVDALVRSSSPVDRRVRRSTHVRGASVSSGKEEARGGAHDADDFGVLSVRSFATLLGANVLGFVLLVACFFTHKVSSSASEVIPTDWQYKLSGVLALVNIVPLYWLYQLGGRAGVHRWNVDPVFLEMMVGTVCVLYKYIFIVKDNMLQSWWQSVALGVVILVQISLMTLVRMRLRTIDPLNLPYKPHDTTLLKFRAWSFMTMWVSAAWYVISLTTEIEHFAGAAGEEKRAPLTGGEDEAEYHEKFGIGPNTFTAFILLYYIDSAKEFLAVGTGETLINPHYRSSDREPRDVHLGSFEVRLNMASRLTFNFVVAFGATFVLFSACSLFVLVDDQYDHNVIDTISIPIVNLVYATLMVVLVSLLTQGLWDIVRRVDFSSNSVLYHGAPWHELGSLLFLLLANVTFNALLAVTLGRGSDNDRTLVFAGILAKAIAHVIAGWVLVILMVVRLPASEPNVNRLLATQHHQIMGSTPATPRSAPRYGATGSAKRRRVRRGFSSAERMILGVLGGLQVAMVVIDLVQLNHVRGWPELLTAVFPAITALLLPFNIDFHFEVLETAHELAANTEEDEDEREQNMRQSTETALGEMERLVRLNMLRLGEERKNARV